MIAVDTNIIIRFLTHDDDLQYKKALSVFNKNEVFIPDTVIQETEWVLRYAYKFSTDEIATAMVNLFGLKNVHLTTPTYIGQAIKWYKQGMDFSDAMHLAQCQEVEKLYTFDKAFISKAKNLTGCLVGLP